MYKRVLGAYLIWGAMFFYITSGWAASVIMDGGVSTTGYVVANTVSATVISATTIRVGVPLAGSDAATKSYVDSAVAAAGGGGVPTYMGATSVSYTGNLGGYSGANAKCKSAYPGSRMMRSSELLIANYSTVSLTAVGWIQCDQFTAASWVSTNQTALFCGTSSIASNYSGNNVYSVDCQTHLIEAVNSPPSIFVGTVASSNLAPYGNQCANKNFIHCVRD